jgi:hypothetical protein
MTKRITSIIVAVLLAAPAIAAAESADAEYKRGQTALRAGRIVEACEAFASSHKLDPKIETELSLADCLEQDGKLVAASRLYRTAADKDGNEARAKKSAAKAAKLEAKAPRLRFLINPKPEGTTIKVDGEPIASTSELRVDIGPHEVIATAPGFEGRASPKVDGARPIIDVIIRMEPKEEAAPDPTPATETPAKAAPSMRPESEGTPTAMMEDRPRAGGPPAKSSRRRNGIVLTAAGAGLAIGAGVMFGISASKFNTESELCPDARCANETDLARANALLDNGTTIRNVGIGVGISGVALLAIGGYLLMTPGESQTRVSVQTGSGTTAITFGGSF